MTIKSNAVKGFTLIEMMMVLTIAALLLTVAVPSFRTFTQNSKLTKQVNLLAASVSMARGEAAKRGARVVLCQSNNPAASSPSCDGTAGTWSNGWVAFVDSVTVNSSFDAGELVVGVYSAESGVDIMTDFGATLVFNADGTTTTAGNKTFAVCDDRGVGKGKQLEIAATGRPSSSLADDCTP